MANIFDPPNTWDQAWIDAAAKQGIGMGDTITLQGGYGNPATTTSNTPSNTPRRGPRPNPYLGRLKGMYEADMKKRKARSVGSKKDLLLRWGSKEMAQKVLSGELGAETDPFLQLISDDPNSSTSTLALINKNYADKQREALSSLNNLNLWFSSGQGETRNEIGRQKLVDIDTGAAQLQQQLTGLDDAIAEAETSWQQRLFDAEQQNWQMQQQFGDYSGGGGGGGGGLENGTPEQQAAAEAYAASHPGYVPHMVMQEGQITYQGGVPGIMVKYIDGNGLSTTEWTPLA